MTVDLRVTGDEAEVAAVLDAVQSVLDLGGRRTYPRRDGFGVGVYVEARLPGGAASEGTPPARAAAESVRVRSERADRGGGTAAVGRGRRALPGGNGGAR